jgi:Resolvase, N terminal domain
MGSRSIAVLLRTALRVVAPLVLFAATRAREAGDGALPTDLSNKRKQGRSPCCCARPSGSWAIDRLGCSAIDLLGTIQTLEWCGVDLYLDQQSIDTTTPAGRLMFQVTGGFAEFERSTIHQRVRGGLARAVEKGSVSAPTQLLNRGCLSHTTP